MSSPEAPGRQRPTLIRATSVLIRFAYSLFGGLRVRGLENIPTSGGAILAPNHLSWADPLALRAVVRRRCWFMANHDIFQMPLVGPLLPLYGAFPVDRTRTDRQALRRAEQALQAGDLVCIFPEGGTTVTGTLVPFEGGVALLAIRTNVPVVPVGITGTDRILPREPPLIPRYARGGATLTFGTPVSPAVIDAELPKRDRVDTLTERLHASVAALLPPEYLPPAEPAA